MRKIKDILRLRHEAGLAYRGVANALNIGYGTVVYYSTLMSVAYGGSGKEAGLDGQIIKARQLEEIASK